jgi:hypothetical protein
MNCNKFIRGVAMLCASSFLWVSCQKEDSRLAETPIDKPAGVKMSGVVPDDPALVAKVPMITSADFMADTITNYFSYQPSTESAKGSGTGGRDRTTPTVNILTPTTGSTVSNTVGVQVSASDNVGVASVVLKVDGNVIATSSAAPYNFSWNTAGLSSGTHTLSATATDAAGNSKISTIQVGYNTPSGADITPPSVTITSPTNGASVESTITVGVAASDNIGVSGVSLKVDGALVSTDNSAPYSFSWNTGTVAAGIHSLTATATDAAGNANSNSIQVTVNTTVITPPPTLPASVQLTMPDVQNQGGEGSCVVFAVGYAARSANQYYKTNATSYNYSTNVFSPEFIYNQIKTSDCGSGTGVVTALNFLVNTGICSWQSMPYSSSNGCSLLPTSTQTSEAGNYKITGYSSVPVSDIVAIKTLLIEKKPVIITIGTDDSFWAAQPGFIWKNYSGPMGISHSLVICGYDDAKHAYRVMNSWGTGWADAGYSWIDYDFLPNSAAYYAYVIN